MGTRTPPILVALVDDYDIVLAGVANMLDGYRDRVLIAEIDANAPLHDAVDIAMYDSFAQPESDRDEIAVLLRNPQARRVVVYSWNFHPDLVRRALEMGVRGYLAKTLPARDLVTALEAVHAGEVVVSEPPPRARSARGWTGPAAARASPIARPRSSRSSRRARATPRSRRSRTSAPTP